MIFSLNQILSGNLQFVQLRNKMIERIKGLSKSLGAVETFHLFSEDLGLVVWEQLEWSYKGMFNGMERKKKQNTENKSLLDRHDLR